MRQLAEPFERSVDLSRVGQTWLDAATKMQREIDGAATSDTGGVVVPESMAARNDIELIVFIAGCRSLPVRMETLGSQNCIERNLPSFIDLQG